MVCHRNELRAEEREKPRGGAGTAVFRHLAEDGAQRNVRMLAEITLPAGASIGRHCHTEDAEFYIVLEGNGTVDDNGVSKAVNKGDVMFTSNGEFHSIANAGSSPLVLHAVVVKA